jgi:hypothetical protein
MRAGDESKFLHFLRLPLCLSSSSSSICDISFSYTISSILSHVSFFHTQFVEVSFAQFVSI